MRNFDLKKLGKEPGAPDSHKGGNMGLQSDSHPATHPISLPDPVPRTRSRPWSLGAGHEKLVRIFDLEKPDTEPEVLQEAPDKVRGVAFLQDDKLLLTSYIDKPGIGYHPPPSLPSLPHLCAPFSR